MLVPADVYLSIPIAASRRYQGLNASIALALSPRLAVQAAYSVQSAAITSHDPRIDNPYSYVVSRSQLPNVPLHAASAVMSWVPRNGVLMLVAGARHTSENNPNNLPSYTTFSAALAMKVPHGRVQIAFENLTDATPRGRLATPANAVPLARRGAAPLRTIATPLAPRTVYLTYTMTGGAPLPAQEAAPPDQDVSAEITVAPTAFGEPPGVDPFQVDRTNPNCFINEARIAERVLRRVGDAVRAAEKHRARGTDTVLAFDGTQDVKARLPRCGRLLRDHRDCDERSGTACARLVRVHPRRHPGAGKRARSLLTGARRKYRFRVYAERRLVHA